MDSNELERERGITIWQEHGNQLCRGQDQHCRYTGPRRLWRRVERALKMVDGVMLLVDAAEGPLPQTRYVLAKALEAKLIPIVVINKIDRPDARPQEVLDEIYDLSSIWTPKSRNWIFRCFMRLPRRHSDARSGQAGVDLQPLFETIVSTIPAATATPKVLCRSW